VWPALENLIDSITRGDPESPLRWTCKSTHARVAEALKVGAETYDGELELEFLSRPSPSK
jgi:hypothetical protein